MRALLSVLLIAALLGGLLPACAKEPSAKELYKRGRNFEKKKDFANAYLMYSQAAAADPWRLGYWQRAQALQRRALTSANFLPTSSASSPQEPGPALPTATLEEVIQARQPQPPVELQAAPGVRNFDLRADSRSLWEQVAKAYGLDVVFDGDFQPGPVVRFRLTGAEYREALHALMSATATFFVPVSSRLLLVVKDTEQKRREVENTVAVAIPIPDPVSVQEAQELGRTVQQVMEIQRFAIDSAQRVVVLRDRMSKVRPAQLLFEQLIGRRAEIEVEVELLAASTTSTLDLGLGVPTTFPISPLVKTVALNGGPLSFALGVTNVLHLMLNTTRSHARTLYRAQLRATDSTPASLHVGEKYPIMTLNYIGTVPEGQQSYTPPPSFNFEDLGLVLKLTPKVHDASEVTLEIDAEFKLLGGASLNGIPIIANRKFQTRARLVFGEAAVISGLVSRNDFRTLSGPAGLLSMPVLGAVLGQRNLSKDDIQVLLVIKPRLLSLPPTEATTREIWVGSESRPRIPL